MESLAKWIHNVRGRNRINKWQGAGVQDARRRQNGFWAKLYHSRFGKNIRFKFHSFSTHFSRWMPLIYWIIATAANYFLILVLTVISGYEGGGVVYGGLLSLGLTVVVVAVTTRYPNMMFMYVSIGLITSILPAVYTGTSLIDLNAYNSAVKVTSGAGVDIRTLASREETLSAEVFDLNGEGGDVVPRFDLMGQWYETIPKENGEYGTGRNAGHDAYPGQITICVVPVTAKDWTPDQPVPLFAVCDNDVRGFRECTAALYGNYDKRDPYGYEILDDCLNNLRTNHEHAVRVGFADYELKKNLFARKAVNATAATHGLLMEPGAPAVSFRSKACCGGEQTMLSAYTLIVVLFFLAPMLYFTGQLCWGKKKKHLPMIRSKEAMLRRIDVMFKHRS